MSKQFRPTIVLFSKSCAMREDMEEVVEAAESVRSGHELSSIICVNWLSVWFVSVRRVALRSTKTYTILGGSRRHLLDKGTRVPLAIVRNPHSR